MATDNTAAAPGEPDANAADWAAAVDSRTETASELHGLGNAKTDATCTVKGVDGRTSLELSEQSPGKAMADLPRIDSETTTQ